MIFTPDQVNAIKVAISSDPTMSTAPAGSDGSDAIARLFNVVDPAFFVYRPTVSAAAVKNAIDWNNLTVADPPDSTVFYTNRVLVCQSRQMNLDIQLVGQEIVECGYANIRRAFQDALVNVPAGAGNTILQAGWSAVKVVFTRNATRIEKLLATGTGTAASPANLAYIGPIDYQTIDEIRNTP